jgi:hypothetical protein
LSTEDPDGRVTTNNNAPNTHNNSSNNYIIHNTSFIEQNGNFIEFLNSVNQNQSENPQEPLDLNLIEKFNKLLLQRPGSRALSVPSFFPIASMNQYTSSFLLNKPVENAKTRQGTSKSFKHTKEEENASNLNRYNDYEDLSNLSSRKKSSSKKTIGFSLQPQSEEFNELNVIMDQEDQNNAENFYQEDYINEEDIDTNMNLRLDTNIMMTNEEEDALTQNDTVDISKLHASISQYKQKFLGSVSGMNEFKEFLKPTSGHRLLKFWLDCEFYRDSMQDYDEIDNMATRNRLFR